MKLPLLLATLSLALAILDRSYYDALCNSPFYAELPVSATQDDIRDAFRRLSKKYHPDRNPSSRERFEKINVGKWELTQPTRRSMMKTRSICMIVWGSRK